VPIIESALVNVQPDSTAIRDSENKRRVSAPYSIVAIGGSAGGLESVGAVLRGLPADFAPPILVVLHLHPKFVSHAAEILRRHSGLKVKDAEAEETIKGGIVYMAPPDRHLLIVSGSVKLSDTPAVNFTRPAIDTTFDSVVRAYGSKVIGIVLSGTGKDGSEGLRAIKQAGGFAIVEDPQTARFSAMPANAMLASNADSVLPLAEIAPLLLRISGCVPGSPVK